MRTSRRNVAQSAPSNVEDAQYCVSCEAVMLFERVEAGDQPVDDPAGEWICVTCGSALLVGAVPRTPRPRRLT
ncbi:MAG TPA: hypothetical protein VGD71_22605 [Kribbella sp.]